MDLEHGAIDVEIDDEDGWSSVDIINDSGVPLDHAAVIEHIRKSPEVAALTTWASTVQGRGNVARRRGTIVDRDRYLSPKNIFGQFDVARTASKEDDIVSGWLEVTEGLAFSKMTMEAEDSDKEDVWNQIARELDLDSRFREMWRELLIYSQFVIATYWGKKTFKVRGTNKNTGVKRKKSITVNMPLGLTILDPVKVVPVGSLMFNRERLAYYAEREESEHITRVLAGEEEDPLIKELFIGPYTLTDEDRRMLKDNGCLDRSHGELFYELRPDRVFRHTSTRSQYDPFADVRMRSIFELLDLKAQLRQMDRVFLVAGTNFIILIKKGSDQHPATQTEVNALAGYAKTLARIPMLVGDHRLSVEIVTPKSESTLAPERYNAIDARIVARLYQILFLGAFSAGAKGDDSLKLVRMIARGLESKRHMIKRTVEKHILRRIVEENPDVFDDIADLRFTPKRVALDFDPNMANFILSLAERGDLSRETLLSEYDFDQDEEFRKRKREADEGLDDVFKTKIPFSSPQNQPFNSGEPQEPVSPRSGGRRGGNRNGGGAAPGTNQGLTPDQQ